MPGVESEYFSARNRTRVEASVVSCQCNDLRGVAELAQINPLPVAPGGDFAFRPASCIQLATIYAQRMNLIALGERTVRIAKASPSLAVISEDLALRIGC